MRRPDPTPNRLPCIAVPASLATAGAASAEVFGEVVPWRSIPLMPDGRLMAFGATPTGGQGGFDMSI